MYKPPPAFFTKAKIAKWEGGVFARHYGIIVNINRIKVKTGEA